MEIDMSRQLRSSVTASAASAKGDKGFGCLALLLQGGGALGSYQAGVFEALAESKITPNWVVGISIGAVNAAIIAGNPPGERVKQLRCFWEELSAPSTFAAPLEWRPLIPGSDPPGNEAARTVFHQASTAMTAMFGVPGFFAPRLPPPWLFGLAATSYYDTGPLRETLERLVDFDRLNAGEMHFAAGSVNVRSGNFAYFATDSTRIGVEHIMASAALPPGFPAVEIDGEYYWDGGLVSNTPLQWLVTTKVDVDILAFQVDLWNTRGELPRSLPEVMTRQKEIQYASRTRAFTDYLKEVYEERAAIADLMRHLPPELRDLPCAQFLQDRADPLAHNIVHLIHRPHKHEGQAKDYEFSRWSMEEHWRAGLDDARQALQHKEIFVKTEGVATFDFGFDPMKDRKEG
jgi:NTE family protein